MLLVVTMNMMRMYSDSTSVDPPLSTEPVLVLGSGGLVGQGLTRALRTAGYPVVEVKGRADMDLRRPETYADLLSRQNYSFCFFLACDVGGARYLGDARNEVVMKRHNEMIYEHLFPFLRARHLPFIFTSSQLAATDTPYGLVKRVGEEKTAAAGGKSIRFWNVYGPEALSSRSHVITDWVHDCVKTGRARSLTTGEETRLFTHTDDIGRALVLLMEHYDEMEEVVDLTHPHGVTSLREIAAHLTPCAVTFGTARARFPASATPRPSALLQRVWTPAIDLSRGLVDLTRHWANVVDGYAARCRDAPYVSLVIATRDDQYGGVRSGEGMWVRTINALRYFIYYARRAYLPFEIVVGEYNKRPRDGSLVNHSNWPAGALYRIRTVPHVVHREWPARDPAFATQSPDKFWEYVGKNAAARIARGQYLLFTNPDSFIHPGAAHGLPRARSHPLYDRTYRAPGPARATRLQCL